MPKKWTEKAEEVKLSTKDALQLIIDTLNQGQRQKLAKDAKVKAMLDFYGVDYGEG